jgi:hypothetical protein
MNASHESGLFIFARNNHAYRHILRSLDAFLRQGNDHRLAGRNSTAEPLVVRANGLPDRRGLGLLSDKVGLLQSCIDFQEVIKFL